MLRTVSCLRGTLHIVPPIEVYGAPFKSLGNRIVYVQREAGGNITFEQTSLKCISNILCFFRKMRKCGVTQPALLSDGSEKMKAKINCDFN